jgi:translation initiation factor 3 subunit A
MGNKGNGLFVVEILCCCLSRARREEEVPYLEAAYKARMAEDQLVHQEAQAHFLQAHRAAWEVDVVEKKRLSVMMEEKDCFQV